MNAEVLGVVAAIAGTFGLLNLFVAIFISIFAMNTLDSKWESPGYAFFWFFHLPLDGVRFLYRRTVSTWPFGEAADLRRRIRTVEREAEMLALRRELERKENELWKAIEEVGR